MSKQKLLTREEQQIVDAICVAEKPLEIRVHLEKTTELDTYDRALEVFMN
jgi:hypothetical protein